MTVVGGLLLALAVILAVTGAPLALPCLALAAAVLVLGPLVLAALTSCTRVASDPAGAGRRRTAVLGDAVALVLAASLRLSSSLIAVVGLFVTGWAQGEDGPGDAAAADFVSFVSLGLLLAAVGAGIFAGRYLRRRAGRTPMLVVGGLLVAAFADFWVSFDCIERLNAGFWRCYLPWREHLLGVLGGI